MAVATARPLSKPLICGADGARGAGAGRGAAAGAGAAGAAFAVGAAAGAAPAVGAAAAAVEAVGATGAGILMVGEAVGLGGKLMRTVSFFGCTLEASAGFGGTAPPGGGVGTFSAIRSISVEKLWSRAAGVKLLSLREDRSHALRREFKVHVVSHFFGGLREARGSADLRLRGEATLFASDQRPSRSYFWRTSAVIT